MANLALLFGILSIISSLVFGGAPYIGIITGTLGIVLGAVWKKKVTDEEKGKCTAALATGIVGVCLSIIVGIICFVIKISVGMISFFF